MSKLTFKRLALALVAALSLGVLASGPSSASQDEALTLTPSATTANYGESITVTVDLSFISDSAAESLNVRVVKTGAAAFTATTLIPLTTDSANVGGLGKVDATSATAFGYDEINAATTADLFTATSSGTYTRAKWTLRLSNATTAGSATYTVSLRSGGSGGGADTVEKAASFTVTVTAANTTAAAATTLVYLNQVATAANTPIRNNGLGYLAADSALVVNAGSASSPQDVAKLFVEFRNSSDTRTSTFGTAVTGSITYVITGPGLIGAPSSGTTATKTYVSTLPTDTVTVYSDGTAGVGTITAYLSGTTVLAQAPKTITFVGIADSFVATVDTVGSVLRGSTTTVSFDALDSAGNKINGTNPQFRTGTPLTGGIGYYLVVADTTVVGPAFTPSNQAGGATTAYSACAYSTVRAKWVCQIPTTDSGTVTSMYVADSLTAATAVKKSAALSATVVGAAYKGTVALDKTSYNVGEAAVLTLTSKDYLGNSAIDGTTSPFTGLYWSSAAPGVFTANSSANATGGTFTAIVGYIDGTDSTNKATYVNGVDTALVYMPTTAGTFTLFGKTAGATTASQILTFTVTDPVQDAQSKAIAAAQAAAVAQAAAAQAAADAATDAALQAIDAANAATDAANLAAEAADAATVAAEEAKDAADAATAAVEALATQVATLMAALQAQVRSLANTVAKIAKKVKA